MIKLFKRRNIRPVICVDKFIVCVEYSPNTQGLSSSVHVFDSLVEARAFKQRVLLESFADCKVKILLLEDYRKEVTRIC